jgi:dTDP-4-dehydrorhamnose reductase
MMRVLVTGVSGQIGSALIQSLATSLSVVAADRNRIDLTQLDGIEGALDRIAPDLIVNPAAYTAVDRAEDERVLAFRVNAEAPGIIAHWAANRGVPLIHFSTDYVFNGTGVRPWREDDAPKPLSIYGLSKLAGENAIRSSGASHLIIRTEWIYGARGTNFLQTIVDLAKERTELRVVADQFGAPTSTRLVAKVVAFLLKHDSRSLAEQFASCGGVLNVAASGETNWHGFAVAIVAGLKARGVALNVENIVEISTDDYPTKAIRPQNSRLDLTRLRETFGVNTPQWDVDLMLELDELAKKFV